MSGLPERAYLVNTTYGLVNPIRPCYRGFFSLCSECVARTRGGIIATRMRFDTTNGAAP